MDDIETARRQLEVAIGYDTITASMPGGGGGVTFLSAVDRDHIVQKVLNAGFRKPREVTTLEEIDALPVDSVVWSMSEGVAYQKEDGEHWDGVGRCWYNTQIGLPARVLITQGTELK